MRSGKEPVFWTFGGEGAGDDKTKTKTKPEKVCLCILKILTSLNNLFLVLFSFIPFLLGFFPPCKFDNNLTSIYMCH